MNISAKTDIGRVRKQNQDSFGFGELPGGAAWVVVCDGMGGAAAGNIASEEAVRILSSKINAIYREEMNINAIRNMLISSMEAANIMLYDKAASDPELSGMGTTAVAAVFRQEAAFIASVGDSRAYIRAGGRLNQLTRDHSLVQAMVENGEITQSQAKRHPSKHIITRALGTDDSVEADYFEEYFGQEDLCLLCTDGLTNYVDNDDILQIVNTGGFYELADRLIEAANAKGGGDNVTAVTVTH